VSSKERTRRYRERLATPEFIEDDMTTQILKRNGYSVNDVGLIELDRHHPSDALVTWDRGVPSRALRYGHQHLAVIQINTSDAKLIDAVVAALDDEPCLVGANDAGAVLVFRVGPSYAVDSSPQAADEFVTADGKPGLLTTDAQAIDVAAYTTWRHERSPLTTHLILLPPMHADIVRAASGAVSVYLRQNGGRFGPLTLPESPFERRVRENRARIAAGIVDEKPTPEEVQARADDALVKANPDVRPTDGIHGLTVDAARKRIEGRKAAKRAEKEQKEAAASKAKMKVLQARLGNVT
jgi:hypothetical protein